MILVKQIKQLFRKIAKGSFWFKITVLTLIILIACVIANNNRPEGFVQKNKFEMKQGTDIYDDFYASIYNDLVFDKIKNEYEVGEIINTTHPTEHSLILDIGSGTGQHVAELNDKGYLYVEGQQNGFDEEVWLITQPRNQYHDYNQEHPKNNETKVFKSTPGRKFLIPAEYDVLILFHPLRNTAGSENEFNKSPSGSFDIKAQY